MSYDVRLEADLGNGLVSLNLLEENYTYNVSPMFHDVIGYSINDWDGKGAVHVASECEKILAAFSADPSKYIAMNPPNGWGDFHGAERFIRKIFEACHAAPNAIVSVS